MRRELHRRQRNSRARQSLSMAMSDRTTKQTYDLVFRDQTDGVATSARIECATDQEAIAAAEQAIGDLDRIEVWQAGRAVAIVGNPRRQSG
jgi:hypothetical protein